jgi:hypothetical protein
MKTYLHFRLRQFIEKLRRLRPRKRPAAPPPAKSNDLTEAEERPRRQRMRYTPMWVGNQILPLPLFEEQRRDPARDFYDEV